VLEFVRQFDSCDIKQSAKHLLMWARAWAHFHDEDLPDLPIRLEVVAEALLRRIPRDAAYKQLPLIPVHSSVRANRGIAEKSRKVPVASYL